MQNAKRNTETTAARLQSYLENSGYRVLSRSDFNDASDVPAGLLDGRAKQFAGSWVIYDPESDEDGFFLTGDNLDELLGEAVELLS